MVTIVKEQREIVKARNKALENYMKLGAVTGTVNYELKKEDSNVKEHKLILKSSTDAGNIKGKL